MIKRKGDLEKMVKQDGVDEKLKIDFGNAFLHGYRVLDNSQKLTDC